MLPEAAVLHRHDRLLHDRRDVVAFDDDPALVAAQSREHGLSVGGVDVAELLGLFLGGGLERGHVARDRADESVGERDEGDESEDAEKRKKSELADPAALGRARASSERHEVGDSSPVSRAGADSMIGRPWLLRSPSSPATQSTSFLTASSSASSRSTARSA